MENTTDQDPNPGMSEEPFPIENPIWKGSREKVKALISAEHVEPPPQQDTQQVFANLKKRFPSATDKDIDQALLKEGHHAGRAAQWLTCEDTMNPWEQSRDRVKALICRPKWIGARLWHV